jgi:acyl-CoA synthetase (AMP-forming)/AMP-acid ligase II
MTLEQSLEHFAQLTPDKAAVISQGQTLSYAELWERIRQKAKQLKEEGLHEDKPYVFVATQDAAFIVTYCAVHLCGAVCVPLESSTPQDRQQQIREELRTSYIVPSTSDILYTTGTTGEAKGVMLSEKAWTANAENLIDRLGFTADLLFIVCGPLNHLGSLSKIYPTLMTGGTLYLLENLKDLNAFFAPFKTLSDSGRVGSFLVPSSIRMLLQLASKQLATVSQKIDFIETGAAPISQHDMERLCQTLPHSRLFNTYASTETGIVCSYEFSKYGCVPGLLGKPMRHSSVRIDGDGRVICSGDTIMSGYVGSPEATARVLREGEIYTSDIGSLDGDGMLRLLGRRDDVINVGGYKVNPSEVEDAVQAFEGIRDCICIPAPHPLLGTVPKLLYVPQEGQAIEPKDIARFLRERIEPYKIPFFYEAVEAIKRTYNGKLDRKAYL